MELKCKSGFVEDKNDSLLALLTRQRSIVCILMFILLLGCGGNESKDSSRNAEIVGKDAKIEKNFESKSKAVDSSEHEHGNKTAVDEVVVQQWPLQAVLNYGAVDVFHEIRNESGNFPTDPDERLYAANHYQPPIGLLNPIKAPDGHHVTLSEWRTAKGTLMVHCNGLNSIVEIVLSGMIPNGVYTTWLGYLNKPKKPGDPLNFGEDFVYRFNPPLGDPSGADNVLIADVDGNIDATVEHPGCILAGAVALGMPILYHINGKTFGGGAIPDTEEVTQLIIYFQ